MNTDFKATEDVLKQQTFHSLRINLTRSWVIWACAALFFCYQFMLRVAPSVMTTELMADFQVDAYTLGLLTSFYFYGYAGMQLPIGAMLDRLGPRRLLTGAALLCTLGSIIFSQAESVPIASLSRLMIGAGSAAGFLSCMKLATVWFPPQKISLVIGFTLLVGTTGAMTGSYPLSYLVDNTSWRETIWISALIGAGLSLIMWFIVRDKAPTKLAHKIAEHHDTLEKQPGVIEAFRIVIKKPQAWLLAGYGFCMYIPLAAFADMWGVPFIMSVHGFDKQTAALTTSALYLGVGMGTPLMALLTDRVRQFTPALYVGSAGALFLFLLVFYIPGLSSITVTSLMFGAGLFLGGQFIAYSIVTEINPVEVAGSASAFQNMVCLTSGIVFQPIIGKILKLLWDGSMSNGAPLYSPENYKMALFVIPLSMICATVISFFSIKEVYPQ